MKRHTNLKWVTVSLASLIVVAFTSGCESKFSEPSPDSVSVNGPRLDERISQKGQIDIKIDQVQKSVEKIKSILDLFKKIDNSQVSNAYTPLDFMLDANKELQNRIPENVSGRLIRRAQITVDRIGNENCKGVDTLLETTSIYDDADSKKVIGEQLTYSVKTCSMTEYAQIVDATVTGSNVNFKLINKNIDTVFNLATVVKGIDSTSCKVSQADRNTISTIRCDNLNVAINSMTNANVKTLTYDGQSDVQLNMIADLYQNGKLKAKPQIQILKGGQIKININEVENNIAGETK
jgi:hypothetical protein